MKAIGVTSEQCSVLAPELPTLREAGIMGADLELFSNLADPASLPGAVRDKLGAALIVILKSDETRQPRRIHFTPDMGISRHPPRALSHRAGDAGPGPA